MVATFSIVFFEDYTLSFDPITGLFGFLSSENVYYIIFVLGLISNAVPFMSYGIAI
jgi:hypothetical protein